MSGPDAFEVDDYAFIGRTFEEYRHMFDLDPGRFADETVLDCPAGPASFVATATDRGISATAVDALYDRPPAVLARRSREDYEAVCEQMAEKRDLFAWDFYGDLEERAEHLERAYETFLEDYPEGRREGRYRHVELPELPFDDDAFSLVLSGHFLFLYGDRLGYGFHRRSLLELARVADDEVRVFPLVGLDTEPYDRLDDLIADLEAEGLEPEVRPVPFEFQKGATEMLAVSV